MRVWRDRAWEMESVSVERTVIMEHETVIERNGLFQSIKSLQSQYFYMHAQHSFLFEPARSSPAIRVATSTYQTSSKCVFQGIHENKIGRNEPLQPMLRATPSQVHYLINPITQSPIFQAPAQRKQLKPLQNVMRKGARRAPCLSTTTPPPVKRETPRQQIDQ